MSSFKKATKAAARLRLALIGPAGSGKTFSALAVGTKLGARVAVIDTERGSASKYADAFGFDVLELDRFEPKTYVDAIRSAEREGYDVLVIDSLSHAWSGSGGILDQLDAKGGGTNSFNAWRTLTPQHNELVDALLRSRCHVIVTMRTKTEYVVEKNERGKSEPRKVGLAPVQRDGLEYEFDVVMDVDIDHVARVSKTRCSELADRAFRKPGEDVAAILRGWLDGAPAPVAEAPRVDWPARIEAATKQPRPGSALIAVGGELESAALNGSRAAVLSTFAAAVEKFLRSRPDVGSVDAAAKAFADRLPKGVLETIGARLEDAAGARRAELESAEREPGSDDGDAAA